MESGEFGISSTIIVISKDRKALIVQRSEKKSFPNMWTVPGGKLQDIDGDFTRADDVCYYPAEYNVMRELSEEVGMKINAENLHFFCSLYAKSYKRFILSFYALIDQDAKDVKITLLPEAKSYTWINEDEIKNYSFIPDIGGEIKRVYEKLK